MPMTLHAPPHRQLAHARDVLHPLHVAMTFAAINASVEMGFVAEVHETREDVDALPRDRLARIEIRAHLADLRIRRIDVTMASDTALDRRDAGKWRPTCRRVTELAAQLVVTGVDDMAEIDRLRGGFKA